MSLQLRNLPFKFAPLVVFLGMRVMLWLGLREAPSGLPSPLIEKMVPSFTLPSLEGRPPALASDDLTGQVSLVNNFASRCVACLQEHPLFMILQGVLPSHGINYKGDQAEAMSWLTIHGNPYERIGTDSRVA